MSGGGGEFGLIDCIKGTTRRDSIKEEDNGNTAN